MTDRYIADQLITMAPGDDIVWSPGVVDVEDGRVAWSGPLDEAPERPDPTVHRIDGILMPGMINTHAHTPMVLLRGPGDGLPTERWLREVMWPREGLITPDDVRAGMRLGASELLRNGITTSVEMYLYGGAVAEAAEETGLRCIATFPVIEDPLLTRFGTWQAQLDEALAAAGRWEGSDLVEIGLGPHAAYTLSDEALRGIADAARDTGMLAHIHVAEQAWEDGAIRERTGMSAPFYLESVGLFDGRVLAAHSVWLSDDDLRLYAERDVAVAHCPCSNMRHAAGIARIGDLQAAGVRIGLGTDGPASHSRLDLFEEMRTASRLARVHHLDAERLPAVEVLRMVTSGAADAVDRPDLGRLVPGCRADMVALASETPALNPVVDGDDPIARVVWAGSVEAVRDVWVGGDHVVEDGKVRGAGEPLIGEVTERAARLAREAVGEGERNSDG